MDFGVMIKVWLQLLALWKGKYAEDLKNVWWRI